MTPAMRALVAGAALAVAGLGVAACGDDDEAAPSGAPGSTTTTTAAPGLDLGAGSEVDLGDGWTVSPCEAGPPLFCARLRGETRATIELQSAPVSSYPEVTRVLEAGGSAVDALRAHAGEYQSTFEADRSQGCGAGYTVERLDAEPAVVARRPGVFYGFDGMVAGRHVERSIQFATIKGDTVHVIATHAVEDGTCMDDGELSEFSVAELTGLQPELARVIAASTLP